MPYFGYYTPTSDIERRVSINEKETIKAKAAAIVET
jgi:hypothetical protein